MLWPDPFFYPVDIFGTINNRKSQKDPRIILDTSSRYKTTNQVCSTVIQIIVISGIQNVL